MFISKKKVKEIEKRIADLERRFQSQQTVVLLEHGIVKVKTIYATKPHALVSIEFQIPYHDWMKLRSSSQWGDFSTLLEEYQMQNNQMSHMQVQN